MKAASLISKAVGYLGGMGIRGTAYKLRLRLRTDAMQKKARVVPHTQADVDAQKNNAQDIGTVLVLADATGMDGAAIARTIDSFTAQTYPFWRLCIVNADAPLDNHADGRVFAPQDSCGEAAYIALLAPNCALHPCALYDVVQRLAVDGADAAYTDELDENGNGLFKPDDSPRLLQSMGYFGGFIAAKQALLKEVQENFSAFAFSGGAAHQLMLEMAGRAKRIAHVPQALCIRHAALAVHRAAHESAAGRVKDAGLVSILIPNKDHAQDLLRCVNSLRAKTTYPDWEIIIIENNSTEKETFACYEALKKDPRIRVAVWETGFNYAAINNFGETFARGRYLLLLNNDVEIITPEWLEEMLLYAQEEKVGAVGAMLYYPDDTVQHAGVIVGVGDVAGHAFRGAKRGEDGYMDLLHAAREVSAVTAACLLMRRDVYHEIGGMDEGYAVAYNDVDMCMRIREAGYDIVFTPHAELYHYESQSRGLDTTAEKYMRYYGEATRFHRRWRAQLEQGDPYHNGNLSKRREDFGV